MNDFNFLQNERLKKQLAFLIEIDKMKQVFRRTVLMDSTRRENDAEHSWHFAMCALILSEYAPDNIDLYKCIKIALVHDLVEIYAGDTFAYDTKGLTDKAEREQKSAEMLFGILPDDQSDEIKTLWLEFEEKKTKESIYANICDRFMPLLHNYITNGYTWKEGNVISSQVLDRCRVIKDNSPELWNVISGMIQNAITSGFLTE